MKIFVCIPARYGSTRFPGKVLAEKTGKYLVQHTYESASRAKSVDDVIVATDSDKVFEAVKSFGGECVMTSSEHRSGTDRIAEAMKGYDADIVVNVQADEPEIEPSSIEKVARLLEKNKKVPMATLVSKIEDENQLNDPNVVKVIVNKKNEAIYFSRLPVPYNRDNAGIGNCSDYLRHLGIYAYRKEFLEKLTKLQPTFLERSEKLEQLRVLENGFSIMVGKVEHVCEGIDTSGQYEKFVKRYKESIKEDR